MNEENQIIQKESVKLTKNTKGYNWEIKLLNNNESMDIFLARLKQFDDNMSNMYGSSDVTD